VVSRIIVLQGDLEQVALEVAHELEEGGLAIIPTDTLYGLAAAAFNGSAIEALYELKGRDGEKPLVLMVHDMEEALQMIHTSSYLRLLRLAPAWPGPLTVIARKAEDKRLEMTTGDATGVGLRIPQHPFTRRLLKLTGPLAVTSANVSGEPAACAFGEMAPEILGAVAVAVDAGRPGSGSASTILDITGEVPRLVRKGDWRRDKLAELLGEDIEEGL
jgi:tRNA threonylcarbamoyl adenosine modification protein (Sua5/YciO/YrdC/YwlC family)